MIIKLTRGKVATIDDDDHALIAGRRWEATKSKSESWYARSPGGEAGSWVLMHRLILGLTDPATLVDHRDGDGLNNRRGNIRPCTRAQNMQNAKVHANSSSGVKGVMWEKRGWRVVIRVNGVRHRRWFSDFDEACRAAEKLRRELHGDFAYRPDLDSRRVSSPTDD